MEGVRLRVKDEGNVFLVTVQKVITDRMMFVSNTNSDLYENIIVLKTFTRNDATEDGYEVVIVKRNKATNCKRRNMNRLFRFIRN